MTDENRFQLTATWDPDAKEGTITNGDGTVSIVHAGAASLGGKGGAANPEELLLAAVSACFVQTWAIFLAKLKVPLERPSVSASCVVDKDPAGGFRVTRIDVTPRIPATLFAERRADV